MNQQRKRTDLTVFLPTGDRSLAVPLPIPLSAASSSSSSINPSDLVRIRILGRGNSGPVHLVCDRLTGQQYALKIVQGLHEDSISGHNSREIEILRTTDSPFIVGCHGLFHQGGEIQILLEYMDRGTMGSLSRPIPEQKLAKMASQILQGLAYLHQQKIVHGNIEPTNILMNGQGQVKISDFGVSRFLTGTGACNSLVGRIAYMSPEQISNQGSDYDGYASDIWSFGMSVLECSLESFPIVLATDDEVDWACMTNEISFKMPPEAPAKSEDFQSFIKCCLQNQPSDRWTAEQLLEHPFIKQAHRNTPAPIDQHSSASSSSSNSPICPSSSLQQQQQRMKEPMEASAMVLDPPPPPPSPPPPLPPPSIPAVRSDPRQPNSSPCSDDDDDLYSCLKSLQRQNEFINIRQENIKDEHKYLKRVLLQAHEELKQMQSVPQVVGQFMEMVDQINGIVESPTGSNYYVPILSTINPDLLKPSVSVALHRLSNSIVEVLPPEADSSISLLSQSEKPDITYDDIGGCEIQKQEIREAIELPLTHPELYKQIGIDPPRGVLLYGPPGTGKTMLAKAVANHTTAAFIPMVGSEFLQKYMGEGASMVRDVFRLAKENAPAIIFIDEVDAIATARLDAESGSEREVHRILIELLNQMDGFEQTVNVKVIMATNRADTLDPALLRPGRIDRIIEFPLPDRREKRLVFQVCTAKMNLSDEVDLEDYVSRTDRISPAEIAAICQEAGMHAIRKNRYVILQKDVERGYRRIVKKPDTDFDFYN